MVGLPGHGFRHTLFLSGELISTDSIKYELGEVLLESRISYYLTIFIHERERLRLRTMLLERLAWLRTSFRRP